MPQGGGFSSVWGEVGGAASPARRRPPRSVRARPRRCRARTAGGRSAARREGSSRGDRSTTRTSERLDIGNQAPAHGLVRQAAVCRAEILTHVVYSCHHPTSAENYTLSLHDAPPTPPQTDE